MTDDIQTNDKSELFIDMKEHFELEYIHFMINILEPFIKFTSTQNSITIIYKGESEDENKEITNKQFVHFLQISFPNFIKKELSSLKEDIQSKHTEKDVFDNLIRLGLDDFKEAYTKQKKEKDETYNRMINLTEEEIEKMKEYYKSPKGYEGMNKLMRARLTYLDRLFTFNKTKHSKIEDVLNLIKNLEYVI